MRKHTAGTWFSGGVSIWTECTEPEKFIRIVATVNALHSEDEAEANAALISAAPNMLSLLESILEAEKLSKEDLKLMGEILTKAKGGKP